jgi:hypothetical protein
MEQHDFALGFRRDRSPDHVTVCKHHLVSDRLRIRRRRLEIDRGGIIAPSHQGLMVQGTGLDEARFAGGVFSACTRELTRQTDGQYSQQVEWTGPS